MSQPFEITGRRIRLRDWKLEDLPVYQHWRQPNHEWYRHDGPWWEQPRVETIEGMVKEPEASKLTSIEIEKNSFVGVVLRGRSG